MKELIAMLPNNILFSPRETSPERAGMAPALAGAWIGGTALGTLSLLGGLGWFAAVAAYGIGGALLLLGLAVLPHLEHRASLVLRPAPVRVGRGARLRP